MILKGKVIILTFKLFVAFLLVYQDYRASFLFNYSLLLYPCFRFPFQVEVALFNGSSHCICQEVVLNLLYHLRLRPNLTQFSSLFLKYVTLFLAASFSPISRNHLHQYHQILRHLTGPAALQHGLFMCPFLYSHYFVYLK